MEGLNMIFNCLYDINLLFENIEPGEGWADRVYKLAGISILIYYLFKYCIYFLFCLVNHKTEGLLGYIYCDFFERTGKLHNDSHYVVRGGRQLSDNSYQVNINMMKMSSLKICIFY